MSTPKVASCLQGKQWEATAFCKVLQISIAVLLSLNCILLLGQFFIFSNKNSLSPYILYFRFTCSLCITFPIFMVRSACSWVTKRTASPTLLKLFFINHSHDLLPQTFSVAIWNFLYDCSLPCLISANSLLLFDIFSPLTLFHSSHEHIFSEFASQHINSFLELSYACHLSIY